MLVAVESYQVHVLLTLAVVMGGYALSLALHLSGPIAIVVAGVLIGGHVGRRAQTVERLAEFWELIDEIFNAVLFVMIGLELLRLQFDATFAWAGALAVPAVLAARGLSVGIGRLIPGLRSSHPTSSPS
jgi:monovalent cation:H+ antiporter, CPA1 family